MKRSTMVLLLMVSMIAASCDHKPEGTDEGPVPSPRVGVEIATARLMDLPVIQRVTGVTDAVRKEKILAPVTGWIQTLKAYEGTSFKTGEVMAVIRPKESYAAIAGAEEMMRSAKTETAKAEAQRAIELARQSENVVEIKAKFDGTVLSRAASEGEFISENSEILTLVDPASIVFLADVPLDQFQSIHPGMSAAVSFTSIPGTDFPARVETAFPQSDAASQTAKVRLNFLAISSHDRAQLTVGRMGEAAIIVSSRKNLLTVPQQALIHNDENDTYSVVVFGNDSLAHIVNVNVISFQDSLVGISGNINAGMNVVTTGSYGMMDSTKLYILPGARR